MTDRDAGGDAVFRQIQSKARSDGNRTGKPTPTAEYLIRHALEAFLDRLTRTRHQDDFILKGGILLAAYGVRRPTRDVDSEAVDIAVTQKHIADVVRAVATVECADGLHFDVDTMTIQEIREGADYPGLRVRITCHIGPQRVVVAWDISTGDPMIPPPRLVEIPRILGDDMTILGYAPETSVAEKGVTILERGIASTRWRDYIDIVQLAEQHGIDDEQLLESAVAVARYRRVALGPIAPVVVGYGSVGQPKWAAWRRKEGLEDVSEQDLEAQMAKVAAVLDPVFTRGQSPT